MTKKPYIVAPGWSYEKAIVAASYGADEVYIGVPFTSLRMRQNKVRDFDVLKKSIDAIHSFGTKALLTMNIFPRNVDIKIFESVVAQIADVWADAIIFSDLWTYKIIKKYLPDTPLHLSTQTSTLNYAAVEFWAELWVKRIVCARELNIKEIKEIKEKVPEMELEVFVHGAMCMTYSGRCLLGEYCSWRDGNKWECSHVCRYKYKVRLEEEKRPWKFFQLEEDEEWSYIMSSKDLCTIHRLEEIIPYVDAIKIEGRSKSEFYVWAMVKAYKTARDAIIVGKTPEKHIIDLVNQIPHRPYRDGFLLNNMKKSVPDGEEGLPTTVTMDSAGPLFARNYFGLFSDETMEYQWKIYHAFTAKENIQPWDKLNFLSRDAQWELEILWILSTWWEEIPKATCNMKKVFVYTDHDLKWWEVLYRSVNRENIQESPATCGL